MWMALLGHPRLPSSSQGGIVFATAALVVGGVWRHTEPVEANVYSRATPLAAGRARASVSYKYASTLSVFNVY